MAKIWIIQFFFKNTSLSRSAYEPRLLSHGGFVWLNYSAGDPAQDRRDSSAHAEIREVNAAIRRKVSEDKKRKKWRNLR